MRVCTQELTPGVCRHAFCCCEARERGLDAQGRAIFELQRAAVRAGVPAAVYTHVDWAEMSPDDRKHWIDLGNAGVDAYLEAWSAE